MTPQEEPRFQLSDEAADAWLIVFEDLVGKYDRGELLIDTDTIPPKGRKDDARI